MLQRLRSALRLHTDVRRYAQSVLDALGRPPLGEDGDTAGVRTLVVGPDPLRVLVLGAGLAVSYGVTTRADGLDGPLARELAERTGRGVVLDNRAIVHVRTEEVRRRAAVAGAHTFRLVIWCPSFAEGMDRISLRAWRAELERLVAELRSERPVPILLTHMPVPSGLHPAALVARPWVHRINRMIAAVAARHEGVLDVATEPFFPAHVGAPITGPAYFERAAMRLVAPALALMGLGVRAQQQPV